MTSITSEDIEGGLPRNFLRPCVLLLLAEEPSHGYDLIAKLPPFGLGDTDPGGLYRTLRAMEQGGLVRSHWETSNAGPARRTYELTDEGEDWLHAWAGALTESRRIMGRFLRAYGEVADDIPQEPSGLEQRRSRTG